MTVGGGGVCVSQMQQIFRANVCFELYQSLICPYSCPKYSKTFQLCSCCDKVVRHERQQVWDSMIIMRLDSLVVTLATGWLANFKAVKSLKSFDL